MSVRLFRVLSFICPNLCFVFLFSIVASPTQVTAKEHGPDAAPIIEAERIIYNPAYFTRYVANTAAEMVQQIPGFTLENESGVRGFGQGRGNMLINGRRPTSKNSSAETQLDRIPASAVIKIEVLKNGSPELAGQSGLIVNIVTKSRSELVGTAEVGTMGINRGYLGATGRLSLTWGRENWTFNLGTARTVDGGRGEGFERLFDANWVTSEVRREWAEDKRVGHEITFGTTMKGANGKVLNLNFKGDRIAYGFEQFTHRFTASPNEFPGTEIGLIKSINDELEYGYEASGDFSFPALDGTFKLIGLRRLEDSKFTFSSNDEALNESINMFAGTRNPHETETLLRVLYARDLAENSILEFAVEGAINKLDQHSTFSENIGEGFINVDVSGSNRAAKEKRGEISATLSHKVGLRWLLQASFAGEYSKISVEDASTATRSFYRAKGFASAQYSFNEMSRIWLRLDRKVGQLDLFNFVSAVNIFEETETSGNINILPDQSWGLELSGERRFGGNNVAKLSLTYTTIEDFRAHVPLADGGEGPGNLADRAKKMEAEAKLTFATDSWGIPGGKLDIMSYVSDISLTDPVTGETHGLERSDFWLYQVDFRQDIPATNWAWGGYIRHWHRRGSLRVDQRFLETTKPWIEFFIEHKNLLGMTARLDFAHLPFQFERRSERAFYAPDRNGDLIGFEVNRRQFNQSFRFNLTKTF